MTVEHPRQFLVSLFEAAVKAADPVTTIKDNLPPLPKGRTIVVGAGKGAAQMAAALEDLWIIRYGVENFAKRFSGVVVTRYGFATPCRKIEVLEASHPVPDEAGLHAALRLKQAVSDLTTDDLVIALLCGGGSALLPAPAIGLTLEDEIAISKALLASGAPISAMNVVRKHLSTIKGGRLAALAHPARVVSLIVSDIPGDNPALVASGPTVPDASTRQDALKIIERYQLKFPYAVIQHLQSEQANAPSPENPCFAGNKVSVIASAHVSLQAAAAEARRQGVEAVVLSDAIEGEAREIAHMHAAMVKYVAGQNQPFAKPMVLLSGGETTVTLRGKGKGGRNGEFALSLALDLDGITGITALAADTDGIDGSENNAGAFVDGDTIVRMRTCAVDAAAFLARNDSWTAFAAIDDLFTPGPTGTNINDFRAILVDQ